MTSERWKRIEALFEGALDLDPVERAAWLDRECAGDAALRAEVAKLLEAEASGSSGLIGAAVETAVRSYHGATSLAGRRIGPYRVLREIGRGGMGMVYLGYRDDDVFHKEVAIKVVQRGLESEQALERFRHERRILALLDHPNIARVIDGGSTEDGLPYLVMEFIEGRPITAYCEDRNLGLRERVELFRKVCSAVQSAHQTLVVHRDLKPSNILVDPSGEPKLLDFGIAKLMDADAPGASALTGDTSRLLTPKYASPEQVMGDPVTTASDIYSLGAILYELLTGRSAHRLEGETPLALLKAICEAEMLAPSVAVKTGQLPGVQRAQAAARLAGDLDNILLKALAKDRHSRYASVEQFSEDLQRYLDNRPVIARPPTLLYRAGKYLRRNRVPVIAAALVSVVLVAATLWSLYEARRAQRRFEQVRRLANVFLFDIHDRIQPLPGSTPVLETAIKVALEYVDSLAAESRRDRSLQYELATAYQKIGDLQGYALQPNLGQSVPSLASHSKALAIGEQLLAAGEGREAIRLVAHAHHRMGYLLRGLRETGRALEHFEQGLAIAEPAYAQDPGDTANALVLSDLYSHLGETLATVGREQDALTAFAKMQQVADNLVATNPTPQARLVLATSHLRLSQAYQRSSDLAEAMRHAEQCRLIRQEVWKQYPANADYKRHVMNAYQLLADIAAHPLYLNLGDLTAALDYGRLHLQFAEELQRADPRNFRARSDLSIAYHDLCAILQESDPAEALQNCRKAIEFSVEMPGILWDSYKQRGILLAAALRSSGDASAARKMLEQVLPMIQEAAFKEHHRVDVQQDLSRTRRYLGDALLDLWELDAAEQQYEEATKVLETLVKLNPHLPVLRRDLADVYEARAKVSTAKAARSRKREERQRHWTATRAWYQKSHEIWQNWNRHARTGAMDETRREKVRRALERCGEMLAELR